MSQNSPHARNYVARLLGVAGALTAVAAAVFGDVSDLRFVWVNEIGLVLLGTIGGGVAGWVCGPMLGHDGGLGWFAATIGFVLATFLGAAVAGTLMLPGLGTMFAPLMLVAIAADAPTVFLVWLSSMIALQLILNKSKA